MSGYVKRDTGEGGKMNLMIRLLLAGCFLLSVIGVSVSSAVAREVVVVPLMKKAAATTKKYYMFVPGSLFAKTSSSFTEDWRFTASGAGYITGGNLPYYITAVAPVQLPHGAVVTMVGAYYVDSSLTNTPTINVKMLRSSLGFIAEADDMAVIDVGSISTDTSNVQNRVDAQIDYGTIDNSLYTYSLYLTFGNDSSSVGANSLFYGVKISYEITE